MVKKFWKRKDVPFLFQKEFYLICFKLNVMYVNLTTLNEEVCVHTNEKHDDCSLSPLYYLRQRVSKVVFTFFNVT